MNLLIVAGYVAVTALVLWIFKDDPTDDEPLDRRERRRDRDYGGSWFNGGGGDGGGD